VYTVIGITVHAAYFLPGSFAGQRFPLLIGMMAVAAYCEHEGYVLRPCSAPVKIVQQRRHHLRRRHWAGYIAGHYGDLFAWPYYFAQFQAFYRFLQSPEHLLILAALRSRIFRQKNSHQVGIGYFYFLNTLAIAKLVIHIYLSQNPYGIFPYLFCYIIYLIRKRLYSHF